MVGQQHNINLINTFIANNNLPHFIILEGAEGSGKKTLLSYIAKKLNTDIIFFENSVAGVRELIDVCYTQTKPLIYSIVNCQQLHGIAQNALLKIVEEPPKNAYIILCTNSHTLLPTIYSRAIVIKLEDYTKAELATFISITHSSDTVLKYAKNCGDIIKLNTINISEIEQLCENIINNINKSNITSVLRISQKIKIKEDKPGIDLSVFLNILDSLIIERYKKENNRKLYDWSKSIHNAYNDIDLGYNKQFILDTLLLSMRVA